MLGSGCGRGYGWVWLRGGGASKRDVAMWDRRVGAGHAERFED